MNIDNMKRLHRALELDGQKFRYSCFIGRIDDETGDVSDDDLGDERSALLDLYHCKGETVGCLAGMAASIAFVEDDFEVTFNGDIDTLYTARHWLGLTNAEASALFYGQAMVDLGMYRHASTAMNRATPLEAAKTVQHWIDNAEQAES